MHQLEGFLRSSARRRMRDGSERYRARTLTGRVRDRRADSRPAAPHAQMCAAIVSDLRGISCCAVCPTVTPGSSCRSMLGRSRCSGRAADSAGGRWSVTSRRQGRCRVMQGEGAHPAEHGGHTVGNVPSGPGMSIGGFWTVVGWTPSW